MDDLTTRVIAKGKKKQKGGGSKKIGRNADKCKFYRTNRYRKNKLAKLVRHMKNHPLDNCAKVALTRLQTLI